FDPAMLVWRPCSELRLDNLDGRHDHLYRRVLDSAGIQPTTAAIPPIESFTESGGLRAHVARCLEIYRELRRSPARVVAAD
ncbi:MAG: hypothetical protein KC486_23850, partial [Myxococcales bacterium]|nr:hypothetical protein [Myxococcales bacterium]